MMRRLPADKYNIAWFKLAEFVVRKEKERALALYRLLVHSLHDEALAHQLEGDLLLAFSDPKAVDAYQKAARAYQENNRTIQAAAVYEHIISLKSGCLITLKSLVDAYYHLNQKPKLYYFARLLIKGYLQEARIVEVDSLLAELCATSNESLQARLYEEIILAHLELPPKKRVLPEHRINEYLEFVLDYALLDQDQTSLPQFLTKLEAVSAEYWTHAQTYLKQYCKS